MANRYPNLQPQELDDLHQTIGDYLEEEYMKAQKAARQQQGESGTDRVAKAIVFLTKDIDLPKEYLEQNKIG